MCSDSIRAVSERSEEEEVQKLQITGWHQQTIRKKCRAYKKVKWAKRKKRCKCNVSFVQLHDRCAAAYASLGRRDVRKFYFFTLRASFSCTSLCQAAEWNCASEQYMQAGDQRKMLGGLELSRRILPWTAYRSLLHRLHPARHMTNFAHLHKFLSLILISLRAVNKYYIL